MHFNENEKFACCHFVYTLENNKGHLNLLCLITRPLVGTPMNHHSL